MWSIRRRRGHHHVGAGPQGAELHVAVHAAVHGNPRQRRVVGEPREVVLDLHRQLARRRQHQHPDHPGRRGVEQALHDGQQEARRLAGARLGAGDEVGPWNTIG